MKALAVPLCCQALVEIPPPLWSCLQSGLGGVVCMFTPALSSVSAVYADLWKTGMFERMSLQTDEDEHSIEMHLPYTAKAMER